MTSLFESSTNKQVWNFSPAIIPRCVLWLDAADANTVTMSGANVTRWIDKSTAPTKVGGASGLEVTGTAPTLATQNGLNTIAFGGAGMLSTTSSVDTLPAGTASGTYFVVARAATPAPTPASPQMMFEYGADMKANKTIRTFYFSSAAGRVPFTDLVGGDVDRNKASGQYSLGDYTIISSSQPYSAPSITSTSFINGAAFTITGIPTTSPAVGTARFSVGGGVADGDGTLGYYLTGNVAEILVYSTVLSTAQRRQIEGYLARKWGLSDKVTVSDHPYKTGLVPTGPYLKGFTLTDIPNCVLWYDGADRSSMNFVGNRITQWRDKSGLEGKQLTNTATSGIIGPTITSTTDNAVGHNIIFNGSQNLRTASAGITSQTEFTYFLVLFHREGQFGRFVSGSDKTDGTLGSRDNNDPSGFCVAGNSVSSSLLVTRGLSSITPSAARSTYHILSCVWSDSSTPNCTVYVNGVATSTFNVTSALAFQNFSIGSDALGQERYLGDGPNAGTNYASAVNEFAAFTGALTDSQRQSVEGYLAWKWGLQRATPSIPETHYFYKFPPATVAPFSPIALGGLALWLDAADEITVQVSSGTSVTGWSDKSGNSRNFALASGSGNPTYSTNVKNGLSAVTFNGTNQALRNDAFVFPNSAYTIFAVQYLASTTGAANGYQRLIHGGPSADTNALFVGTQTGNVAVFTGNAGDWNDTTALANPAVSNLTVWRIVSLTVSAGSLATFVDGSANTVKTGTTGAFTGLDIGSRPGDPRQQSWNGYVSEILVYNSALTTHARRQVEGYLAWKWGMQSSLPSSHPYSKAPV